MSAKRCGKKRKSPVMTCPPSFIYIPACHLPPRPCNPQHSTDSRRISAEAPVPTWSGICSKLREEKKRQPQLSGPDFEKLYRRSDIIDKRLFLNSCFIAPVDEVYSPNVSPDLLTPITPYPQRVIDSTFTPGTSAPGSANATVSPLVQASSGYQTQNTGTMVSRATTAGSQITTFISEDYGASQFSFDETTINRFYSSSLKKEVIALL